MQRDTFYSHQEYEQVNCYKNRVFISLLVPSETKVKTYLQLVPNWNISTKIWQNFFYEHYQPLYDGMEKKIVNFEFVQGVNFELIDLLKNSGIKYLIFFDQSSEEFCISKAFADNATAGRPRGLSTIYIKHNLFHQSKLGRDMELQNTQIILFTSPLI